MPISEADIEKIAQLAHLDITDDERKMFAPQISEIVTYVEQLNADRYECSRTRARRADA